MAQLSDDCFAADDRPMSLDEAVRIIAAQVTCVADIETVALAEAGDRILASDVVSPLDLPPYDNSAVDGYAVRFADLRAGTLTVLPVEGRVAAGGAPAASDGGIAVRIFTGAAMPAGFDTVFMQEDVTIGPDGRANLPAGLKRGNNRREAGEDIRAGTVALADGRRLGPAELALLGAIGAAEVPVRARLRVAVFSTGDEVTEPGSPLASGHLYDANRPMLCAWLKRLGCVVTDLGILPDKGDVVRAALRDAARGHDLAITSGGVSMGDEDHVREAFAALGSLTFWKVGIKPGRPVALGTVDGVPFAGLPGNPVAAFVTFATLVRPLVARLAGEAYVPPEPIPVRAGFAYRKKTGRREFLRAQLGREGAGFVALKHPRDGSGMITSLTETDGLVVLPEDVVEVSPGDLVPFLPYSALL